MGADAVQWLVELTFAAMGAPRYNRAPAGTRRGRGRGLRDLDTAVAGGGICRHARLVERELTP